LIPPPHRVGEDQRRLRGEEDTAGSQRQRGTYTLAELPQRQRREAGEQRQVGLEDPGELASGQLGADTERDEGADRVPAGEVEVERRLIARGRQIGKAAAVLHQPIGDREPGGGVVELYVPGEGRLARKHDRGGEDGKNRKGDEGRPGVGPQIAALDRGENEAGESEHRGEGRGPARRRRGGRRSQADDCQARHAQRRQQGTGHAAAREGLGQQAEAEADSQQQGRKGDPGGKHGLPSRRATPSLAP
jgi:hypothetical protein